MPKSTDAGILLFGLKLHIPSTLLTQARYFTPGRMHNIS